jgi:hypothetical protein
VSEEGLTTWMKQAIREAIVIARGVDDAEKAKIVFLSGSPCHGPMQHLGSTENGICDPAS